jgi:hypothetical protein
MRPFIALLIAASTVGCQPADTPEVAPGSAVGSTATVPGSPAIVRTDTTPAGAGSQSTPTGGATLTLDRASYRPGATVNMRIASQTRDTLGFNQCSSRVVERQEGTRWVPHPEPDRMCTMELRLLMPNETQTATTDLPATVTAGTYRMVLTLSRQSTTPGEVRAVSAPFRVN